MSKNNIIKSLWLITCNDYLEEFKIVALASNEKDCIDLVNELDTDNVLKDFVIKKIGNSCPSEDYYKSWQGESFIIMSNLY